ncbi:hypothetical protein ROLI_030430 [Roseobacter fucihabitans]|uniref:Uncharacterized protein n=1 Tax=Roseobacter fucihabitans TaxID=1537242 RepID=A0ABZ2BW61_9RHOB
MWNKKNPTVQTEQELGFEVQTAAPREILRESKLLAVRQASQSFFLAPKFLS